MAKFMEGDVVRCLAHHYSGVQFGEYTSVVKVSHQPHTGNELITLKNSCSPYGTSDYDASNFKLHFRPKRNRPMATAERTKYFAVKLNPAYIHDDGGLVFDEVGKIHPGDIAGGLSTTPLRNSQHEVRVDVNKRIAEGDKWLVVQTVALLEGEEPRPPIRVTEYK